MSNENFSVVLAGGGTAGHVNPLIATAKALHKIQPSAKVTAVGTRSGLETSLVPDAGLPLEFIPRVPLPRKPSFDLVRLPMNFKRAVQQAKNIISSHNAQVVVGFGGYVSTPMYYAAHTLGIPIVVHESNARPGLANKIGARWAQIVALTFASTNLRSRRGITLNLGLPLKQSVTQLADPAKREKLRLQSIAEWGFDPHKNIVVVTGGSSGALHINEVVSAASPLFLDNDVQVLHITGRGKDAPVRDAVRNYAPGSYVVLDYLNDMAEAYAVADVIVARSGANTVAEVSALGIPAVFVPLPIGNGEQALNARDVVDAGGALLVKNEDFSETWIGSHLIPMLKDDVLSQMRRKAQAVSSLNAAENLADIIVELAK